MKVNVKLVKAFTQNPEYGNPAGVVLNADNLSDEQMIKISAKLGFSESAFVQKSTKADFRVRFFTPQEEVSLCGHATIATFKVLVTNGDIEIKNTPSVKTQETGAGVLSVTCFHDGLLMMDQQPAEFLHSELDRAKIAWLLRLKENDLLDYPIQTVSTGASKLIIPIKSIDLLFSIKPNLDGIKLYSEEMNTRGFYPFTLETIDPDSTFHARQFNPLIGINEDPITGVAAGPLGAYAQKYKLANSTKMIVEQGKIMNKPGKMIIDLTNGVKVGGYAVIYDEQNISI